MVCSGEVRRLGGFSYLEISEHFDCTDVRIADILLSKQEEKQGRLLPVQGTERGLKV